MNIQTPSLPTLNALEHITQNMKKEDTVIIIPRGYKEALTFLMAKAQVDYPLEHDNEYHVAELVLRRIDPDGEIRKRLEEEEAF